MAQSLETVPRVSKWLAQVRARTPFPGLQAWSWSVRRGQLGPSGSSGGGWASWLRYLCRWRNGPPYEVRMLGNTRLSDATAWAWLLKVGATPSPPGQGLGMTDLLGRRRMSSL